MTYLMLYDHSYLVPQFILRQSTSTVSEMEADQKPDNTHGIDLNRLDMEIKQLRIDGVINSIRVKGCNKFGNKQ